MRLLYSVRKCLNTDVAIKTFNMTTLPILTYSGPLKSIHTKTQSERLTSLNNRAKRLTKNCNLKNVLHKVNKQNCIFVKKCLLKQPFSSSKTRPRHKRQWDQVKTAVSKIRDLQTEFLF